MSTVALKVLFIYQTKEHAFLCKTREAVEHNGRPFSECSQYLSKIDCLNPPRRCCSILKTTDAGPGVGITNAEVRFRDAEIASIHSSDRVNRIHRAPGDSARNEAERTNAAIGDALVDGSALRWEYSKPFDGLTIEEIDALSASE